MLLKIGGMKMLLWAKKNEINMEIIRPIGEMYDNAVRLRGLENFLKAWELSIIFKQIQEHFGDKKDISILDFGAGRSPFGAFLNHIGYQDITCLDEPEGWHPEINQETYNKKYNSHIKYVKVNIVHGYDGEYDVIFSASVLEHIKDRGIGAIQILSKNLKPDGLFIHVADYDRRINFKELIGSCNVSISYKPEETPGCEEFKTPPKDVWMEWDKKKKKRISRVAFFNEKKE